MKKTFLKTEKEKDKGDRAGRKTTGTEIKVKSKQRFYLLLHKELIE